MRFTSTRDKSVDKSFLDVILNCMPADGGLYVPEGNADLRRWILYTNEKTTFTSIAGTLTSAYINDEFSPIICETIATRAFTFEPALKKLDENLYTLELFNGPTGSHRDFGVSFLTACLETILTLHDKKAVFLDMTTGEHGAILSREMRGKRNLKSVLVYPKGMVRGLNESDFVWNGGNVYPVEVDGNEDFARALVREIYSRRDLVQKYNLTVSTTANMGRLLPQAFFYTYAFSRLKGRVSGDIYYALAPGNYSNLMAGLYSWRLSLPLNGFIVPASGSLNVDVAGCPVISDSIVPLKERPPVDPCVPDNLERLEDFFTDCAAMIKSFIFPQKISDSEAESFARDLYKKYGVYTDRATARAYGAAVKNGTLEDGAGDAVVLIQRDHPAYSKEFIQRTLGEKISIPENVAAVQKPFNLGRPPARTPADLAAILSSVQST